MARSPDHLTVAQFELLKWVSHGCEEGVYDGSSYRVSARGLHNRGLIQVEGRGKTWTATITPEGTRLLKEQAQRVEAEREHERREERARVERDREQQRLRAHAVEVLDAVVAAGGRLDLGAGVSIRDFARIAECLTREELLPEGQRLAQEPTRMDPDLGVTAYLEPDFATLTRPRDFEIPRQLRDPHPAVVAFRDKRMYVSRPEIARAARFLQAIVSAATKMGWKVPVKASNFAGGRGEVQSDLTLRLPSREVAVTVREIDRRGRVGLAFTTDTDYYTRTQRTTTNKNFLASGRLEVTLAKVWEQQPILSLRDTDGATLEEQLPTVVHTLEVGEAEAQWALQEEERRAQIRQVRWEEVKKEAFAKLTYERNAERLRDELARRDAAAAMRAYAGEIDAHAASLGTSDQQRAREWAGWIRRHAESSDPINGSLQVIEVTTCNHSELQPHMNGWSTYGPHRQ